MPSSTYFLENIWLVYKKIYLYCKTFLKSIFMTGQQKTPDPGEEEAVVCLEGKYEEKLLYCISTLQ